MDRGCHSHVHNGTLLASIEHGFPPSRSAVSDGEPWSNPPVQHRKDALAAPADYARSRSGPRVTETVAAIVAAHRAGMTSPAQTVARSFARIRDHNDPAIFISLRDEKEAVAEAEALSAKDAGQLPLYGIPVAVKDNIDVTGLPTTAGCPAFSYVPSRDATCVARLRAAGAIMIGKTNLDQFATGLVGVRSPYGIPKNPIRGDLIPGGSSSGSAMAGPDGADPYSRHRPLAEMSGFPTNLKLGVPRDGQLIFFGDKAAEKAYGDALKRWTALGATLVGFDLEPFYETARLLYEGPWVAERYLVIRDLLASSPEAIHPVTRDIIVAGSRLSAADTFAALYLLQALRKIAERAFAGIDALALPTAPTVYSTAQVLANPVELNSRLGTYTNFVNLLDLCGLALPAAIRSDGIPFGITLLAPAGNDAQLASIGRVFHADTKLTMGAKGLPQPPLASLPAGVRGDEIAIAVVGAHLSGMVLNGELKALGGRLLEQARTAQDYKLYALDTTPPKPGMLRVEAGTGSSIELEVWALSAGSFGKFVAAIPPPLSIGTIRLADGRGVKGFIVEPTAVDGARDISAFSGWRAFMADAAAG